MQDLTKFYSSLCLFGAAALFSPLTLAINGNNLVPQIPALNLWGFTGTNTLGRGEALLPLLGQSDRFLFADTQGKYGEHNTWLGSAALGYRQNYQQARILGAYVFADRSETQNNAVFWDVSPGIESMGKIWDFRVNGYFPVGSKNQHLGDFFGSQCNEFQFVEHSNI